MECNVMFAYLRTDGRSSSIEVMTWEDGAATLTQVPVTYDSKVSVSALEKLSGFDPNSDLLSDAMKIGLPKPWDERLTVDAKLMVEFINKSKVGRFEGPNYASVEER